MTQKQERKKYMIKQIKSMTLFAFAVFFWILNIAHAPFTIWAIAEGGGMEMMAILPIVLVQILAIFALVISTVIMIIGKKNRKDCISVVIPGILIALQSVSFWCLITFFDKLTLHI